MAQLPRQHYELSAMMRLVAHEVSEKVDEVRREVLPGGWRDGAATSDTEPDYFNHARAAACKSALQL